MKNFIMLIEAAMTEMYVSRDKVPATILGGYSGNKIKIKVCSQVSVPMTSGRWDGGSRDSYFLVNIADGKTIVAEPGSKVYLEPGFCVVENSIFQGKDSGITIYALQDDIAPLLVSDKQELTQNQKIVLAVIKGIKSSYRKSELERHGISGNEFEQIKSELFDLGLIDKRGAVTIDGKNTPTPRL